MNQNRAFIEKRLIVRENFLVNRKILLDIHIFLRKDCGGDW